MNGPDTFSGYLDVKISARSRRGFTPWKAWHKQWCEIKKLDSIDDGAELKLKTSEDGAALSSISLPRSSTVCRINSSTKEYAFGVYSVGRGQKPLLFLSGSCESDAQKWMDIIRRLLSIAVYIPVASFSFHISVIDNAHSRAAGLTGLYGILSTNCQEIIVSDPATGEVKIKWKWHQFHHFHLSAVAHLEDENTICVIHTSKEFTAGPGQLHIYCQQAPQLLQLFLSKGKCRLNLSFLAMQRLSQSDSELITHAQDISQHPNYSKTLSDSDDSGVQVSLLSEHIKNKYKILNCMSQTPGGSEADEDDGNIEDGGKECACSRIPRGESGISLASGVYEEILDTLPGDRKQKNELINVYSNGHMAHVYEDPDDLSTAFSFKCDPPPLPPRIYSTLLETSCDKNKDNISIKSISNQTKLVRNTHKYRSTTLPSKDLKRLSQTFSTDSEYMVMLMPKTKTESTKTKTSIVPESLYVPMSPIVNNIKTKIESCYMVMSRKKC